MRILHTSDWHLGQRFYDYERIDEQEQFLKWLLHLLDEREIDVLLIAGDLFDVANPSALSQQLFYQFMAKCAQREGLQVIVTSGNHDGAARLGASRAILNELGIHLQTSVTYLEDEPNWDELCIPLYDELGVVCAYCLAVPYLRSVDLGRSSLSLDEQNQAIASFYERLFVHRAQMLDAHLPTIVMGHLFMNAGQNSDSEKLIVGNLEGLSADVFVNQAAYVALGHLHKAQRVAKDDYIRYSGSPYPLSFSEMNYRHEVVLLTLDQGDRSLEFIKVPRVVELQRIGTPEHPLEKSKVLAQLQTFGLREGQSLSLAPFLEIHLALSHSDLLANQEIREQLADKYVRLVGVRAHLPRPEGAEESEQIEHIEELLEISPEVMFERYYQGKYGQEPAAEVMDLLREVVLRVKESNR